MKDLVNGFKSLFDIDSVTGEILFTEEIKKHVRFLGRAFIGNNILLRMADIIPEIKTAKSILIATYKDIHFSNTYLPMIRRSLNNLNNKFIYFNKIQEPSITAIKELTDIICREAVDVLIALGGGTVIDVAKCTASLALQEGEIEDYLIDKQPFNSEKRIQMIAVPTIVSSGSEGNDCAVYIGNGDIKTSVRGLKVPFVLIDPLFLSSVSVRQATITGLDGFCQSIETFVNPNSNTFNDLLSLEAIRLFDKNLPSYLEGNINENILWELSIAGYLHAISNFNVTYEKGGLGLAHSLVHLCNKYKIMHGNMVAILLPSTLRFLVQESTSAVQKLQRLSEIFHIPTTTNEQGELINKVIDYIENFIKFFLRRANLPIVLQESEMNLCSYMDIIETEKSKIINGPLNLKINDEQLLMILRGKQDFSGIAMIREKILLDILKMATKKSSFTNDLKEIRLIEGLLADILNNYHFIKPYNVRMGWGKRDDKDLYEWVDKHIQKKYKYAVKKIRDKERIFGIC
ncbi:MAG: iron-containing alcohol dehydrogenase [bacterium]